ncbi:polymorphic toxin type 22 domain-containing protein [Paraburkholderia sp. BR13444]|uniref:polymorphic toxin type 22 domain-containing protein n=1 Tax=Paraburkholderia TaxID=1822464 RepID=UPI0034CDBC51
MGWIFGASGARATNNFMNGDGNQFVRSVPTPVGPNAVFAITHAYGGPAALELGVANPGPMSVPVTPCSYSARILNSK